MKCLTYKVIGRVQGVGFRAATKAKAIELNLYGWVKNVQDGSVELLACGDESSLQAMEAWLTDGPEYAMVTSVLSKEHHEQVLHSFSIHF